MKKRELYSLYSFPLNECNEWIQCLLMMVWLRGNIISYKQEKLKEKKNIYLEYEFSTHNTNFMYIFYSI